MLQVKRTGARTLAGTALPYAIEVIAADRAGGFALFGGLFLEARRID